MTRNAEYRGLTEDGRHKVNFDVKDYKATKGNIRATLVHEMYGHGIKGWGTEPLEHYQAIQSSIKSKYFAGTTKNWRVNAVINMFDNYVTAYPNQGRSLRYSDNFIQAVHQKYHPHF